MLKIGVSIQLSASDLVGHLNCRYLTNLDIAVANGVLAKPKRWDPLLETLRQRGAKHEQEYVDHLRNSGFEVAVIGGVGIEPALVEKTAAAMKSGRHIIVQGAFRADGWGGRTDILRRVHTPSRLGAWSYEVIDTKLARETKGGAVLQLCVYSDLVASVQGLMPEFTYIVAPWSGYEPQPFRTKDFAAYHRYVKRSLNEALANGHAANRNYPDPKEHCDICRWQRQCDVKRHEDDDLCLVAGISKAHINELKRHNVQTIAQLAAMPLPLAWRPERGAIKSYERIREQARLQAEGRAAGCAIYEMLPLVQGFGLSCLPLPSRGDIFFDLEGDPFVGEGGLEYLFGYAFENEDGRETYTAEWAFSRADEKHVFERFVDFVMERLRQYPDLHIYHYAPYEPGALKRLTGRYATREGEIDRMLRSRLFVDLYRVVRHGLQASVESYSIKKLEQLYKYERNVVLSDANSALSKIQACMQLGDQAGVEDQDRRVVQGYNRDDCLSTWQLREWLEGLRSDLIAKGNVIDRPVPENSDPSEDLSEWQEKIDHLIRRLTADVPEELAQRNSEQQGRWLLAHILDWHRREEKVLWWEYFRLSDLNAEELMDERVGLAGLRFFGVTPGNGKTPTHRYNFPPQETELRGGEELYNVAGAKLGKVQAISIEGRWVDIKKRGDSANIHPEAVFAHEVINTKVLANALVRIGECFADNDTKGEGRYQAARDLLMREAPRIGGEAIRLPTETLLEAARRIAPKLNGGVLPIQGPPGAGKTHIGARMICALVNSRFKIGIAANSHKVIRNLLDEVVKAADEARIDLQCIQKVADKEDDRHRLRFTTDNTELLDALRTSCHVAAGTAWLWAREDASECVDVLFVDEAAQMSLANVLAVSQAAKTIVLLGDPRQLEQPTQGSHPEGTNVSALDHILGDRQTLAADRGLFLEETWRLHPDICAFVSELFYESRLRPHKGLEQQEIRSNCRIKGSGLRFLSVSHEGNQSSSPEEADRVGELVTEILNPDTTWVDRTGAERPVALEDILIIAPYNAQVFALQERLPSGARVGTVDKFQGQEAPIVIYSMTTSSQADAPRGMEFLYSPNRFNVAISRAKCLCIVVGSPSVFEAQCRTPRQMQLANAFCRYLELAGEI
jgi:predicted RecB family nuclease